MTIKQQVEGSEGFLAYQVLLLQPNPSFLSDDGVSSSFLNPCVHP